VLVSGRLIKAATGKDLLDDRAIASGAGSWEDS